MNIIANVTLLCFLLRVTSCHSSPVHQHKPKDASSISNLPQEDGANRTQETPHAPADQALATKDVIVIDLEKVNKMSILEYVGRRMKSLWDYLVYGIENEPEKTFLARCFGVAKKIRQILPFAMVAGGVIITKLGFLVLFSLKTLGLVGLLLLLNVGAIAAKLGAFLASKKSEQAQNLHVHVQPWKKDEHVYSSSHYSGPPYGWDDRSDADIQSHELYNLYEKLKLENNFRRFLASNGHNSYHMTS